MSQPSLSSRVLQQSGDPQRVWQLQGQPPPVAPDAAPLLLRPRKPPTKAGHPPSGRPAVTPAQGSATNTSDTALAPTTVR
jgi:hypothetical protein